MDTKFQKGDRVVARGEVIWVDEDGTPRVRFKGGEIPIRISASSLELVSKPVKPKQETQVKNP